MRSTSAVGDKISSLIRGRTFLLVGDSVEALASEARVLLELGAHMTPIIGDGIGLTAPPSDPRIPWIAVNVTCEKASDGRRRATRALTAPAGRVVNWLNAVDPHRAASVLNYNGRYVAKVFAHRAVLGAPRRGWSALDDKTACDGLWEAANVRRMPSRVVAADLEALLRCAAKLDRGAGTVWAGDSRAGINSGAELTRHVRDFDDAVAVAPLFARRCNSVRVTPFVEGIPCSVHAMVSDQFVAVLRPCETFVLRDRTPGRFCFAGMGTSWDPDAADRGDMRAIARRIAKLLQVDVGYRGALTVDGVLGEEGFIPTEVNPRVGRALRMMSQTVPEAGLLPHALFLAEGRDAGLSVYDIETIVLDAIDSRRTLLSMLYVVDAPAARRVDLLFTHARTVEPTEGGARDAVFSCGRALSYSVGLIRLESDIGSPRVGASASPIVADALNRSNELLGVRAGTFSAPAEVR